MTITAKASANIALVKYWGKSDPETNIPAVDSLSVTLAGLDTVTHLTPVSAGADEVFLNDSPASPAEAERIVEFLDLFRVLKQDQTHFRVQSSNHFPTGAGLASSASGFAALGTAAAQFYGMVEGLGQQGQGDQAWHDIVNIVRQGSGSAPRSLMGGFVHLERKSDCIELHAIESALRDDLVVIVGITDRKRKEISSRKAMLHSQETSPYWGAWLEAQQAHIGQALEALKKGDFAALGAIAEQDAQCMHATCHTANPPIYYWNAGSIELLRLMGQKRAEGWPVYCTMDAGPQVKVLTLRSEIEKVRSAIESVPGCSSLVAMPGAGSLRG